VFGAALSAARDRRADDLLLGTEQQPSRAGSRGRRRTRFARPCIEDTTLLSTSTLRTRNCAFLRAITTGSSPAAGYLFMCSQRKLKVSRNKFSDYCRAPARHNARPNQTTELRAQWNADCTQHARDHRVHHRPAEAASSASGQSERDRRFHRDVEPGLHKGSSRAVFASVWVITKLHRARPWSRTSRARTGS